MNSTVSQSYIDKNNELAGRQLVLAAHRLTKVIQMIFGTATEKAAVPEGLAFLQ